MLQALRTQLRALTEVFDDELVRMHMPQLTPD